MSHTRQRIPSAWRAASREAPQSAPGPHCSLPLVSPAPAPSSLDSLSTRNVHPSPMTPNDPQHLSRATSSTSSQSGPTLVHAPTVTYKTQCRQHRSGMPVFPRCRVSCVAHLLPSAVRAGSPKCGGVVLNCGKAGTLRLSSDLLTPTSVLVEASSPDVPSASPGDGTAWVGGVRHTDTLGQQPCDHRPPRWRETQALASQGCR